MTPAFKGAYVDQSRTWKGPFVQTAAPIVPLPPCPPDQSSITVYQAAGTDIGHQNPGVTPPPHAPMAWRRGRDPYANGGMAGQPFIENQG